MPGQTYAPGNTQRLTLDISHCLEETRIFELKGQQTLSAPFELSARFISPVPDLDLNQLIRQSAIITLYYKDQARYFHGIIKDAAMLGENGQSWVYQITLVPKLWFMNYRTNCRTFQQQNVVQIISQLLKEASLKADDYRFRLKNTYAPLNYTVQFNESDYAFISRLLERSGIHYHFEHHSDKHILVFADVNEALPKINAEHNSEQGSELELRPRNGLEPQYSSCESFSLGTKISFDQATHIGFDLTRPARSLQHVQQLNNSPFLEHYSFHEHLSFELADAGQHYIDQSLQAFNAQSQFAETRSDVIHLEPGHRFKLINHPRADFNQGYLIHSVQFTVQQYTALEQYSGSQSGFHYHNNARLIPDAVRFKPPQITPRPQLDFQDGVFVSGPEGEEIHTDSYGRIKVQFPWDREGQNNEHSSCWLPVSQSWAGNQWGKIQLPRIGHEVLVSFINGDPDQPVVMGSLYNGRNRPPCSLPEHKTRSTTKTSSSMGGQGYNEIRMEDKKGQEQVAIFAQKDIDNRVKHDRREHIEHDRHLIVEKDRFEHIKNNHHLQTDHNRFTEVGQDVHRQAGDSIHTRIGKDLHIQAGDEIHIKAGNTLVFDAGEMLSMKVGRSVMKTSAGGIGFNGASIRINEGGSPGIGSGASPIDPLMPQMADKDHPGYKARPRLKPQPHIMPPADVPSELDDIPVAVKKDGWLNIHLVDDNDTPFPDENYLVKQGDTIYQKGRLDRQGFAQVSGIPEGQYRVIFPAQELEFWMTTQSTT